MEFSEQNINFKQKIRVKKNGGNFCSFYRTKLQTNRAEKFALFFMTKKQNFLLILFPKRRLRSQIGMKTVGGLFKIFQKLPIIGKTVIYFPFNSEKYRKL